MPLDEPEYVTAERMAAFASLVADPRLEQYFAQQIDAVVAEAEAAIDRATTWRERIVDGATWLRSGSTTVEPLWGDGDAVPMARNQPTLAIGGPGAGKTTLAQAVALGTIGTPGYGTVLGWPVREMPGETAALFLASDRPDQARLSLHRMIDTPDAWDVIERRLRIWQGPPPASIAKRPSLLLEMAEHAQAGFVVVDSLKDMAIGLTEDEVGASINQAHQMLVAQGIDVLSLHHPRKRGRENADSRWTIDDLYGSAWLAAGAGSVIFLERGPTSTEATQAKSPNGIETSWRYTIDLATGRLAAGAVDDVMAAVRDAGPEGISTTAVARWVLQLDRPEPAQIEQVRRQLKRLESSGAIETTGAGRNTRWIET